MCIQLHVHIHVCIIMYIHVHCTYNMYTYVHVCIISCVYVLVRTSGWPVMLGLSGSPTRQKMYTRRLEAANSAIMCTTTDSVLYNVLSLRK